MATGIVKFFNRPNNFGVITPDEGGMDIFVHGTNINGYINEGDSVEFELGQGRKGLEAKNVIKISSSASSQTEEDMNMSF